MVYKSLSSSLKVQKGLQNRKRTYIRNSIILFLFLILFFYLSFLLESVLPQFLTIRKSYTLLFPDIKTKSLKPEVRQIIYRNNRDFNIKKVISELFLGPINDKIESSIPANTEIYNCFVLDRILHLNISDDIAFSLNKSEYANFYHLLYMSIIKTILFNFHSIDGFIFKINGNSYRYCGSVKNFDIVINYKNLKESMKKKNK